MPDEDKTLSGCFVLDLRIYKVISSKLFLDLEPSFSEYLFRALRGCFRGASVTQCLVSFRFKVRRENLQPCGMSSLMF